MAHVLIAYATKHGQTEAIADAIRAVLEERGHEVTSGRLKGGPAPLPPAIDAVIVGGSVHAGRHLPALREWVDRERPQLESRPAALFQVCLSVLDPGHAGQAKVASYVDELVGATEWHPPRTVTFAGALAWSRYGFLTRMLMRAIVRRQARHLTGDRTSDRVFTDWDAVRAFASEFSDELEHASR